MGNDLASYRANIGLCNCRIQKLHKNELFLSQLFPYISTENLSALLITLKIYFSMFLRKILICVLSLEFVFLLMILLINSGDVETNPGSLVQTSDKSSISILHLNIRSIRNKHGFIKENL
jgi:hypothetical protein